MVQDFRIPRLLRFNVSKIKTYFWDGLVWIAGLIIEILLRFACGLKLCLELPYWKYCAFSGTTGCESMQWLENILNVCDLSKYWAYCLQFLRQNQCVRWKPLLDDTTFKIKRPTHHFLSKIVISYKYIVYFIYMVLLLAI